MRRCCERIPDALLRESLPADRSRTRRHDRLRQALHVAITTRARRAVVLAYPSADDRGAALAPLAARRGGARRARRASGRTREEELFGPAETLHSTYRLLRDELLEGTMRAGGRLGELRFDTDLDVYARGRPLPRAAQARGADRAARGPERRGGAARRQRADPPGGHRRPARDLHLLGARRVPARRRARRPAARAGDGRARDEPSLEPFLPKRGDGVVLSASDIDTYRTCPLKYKFARVFRIPQEPTIHQRFGIVVHQVLERFHAGEGPAASLSPSCSVCSTRRGGAAASATPRRSASCAARRRRR